MSDLGASLLIASNRGTAYCPASDENALGDWKLGAVTGGICRASGEYSEVGESAVRAFDHNPKTKWLEPSGANALFPAWLEYRLVPDTTAAVVVASYTITSANDHPERDPSCWVLEGLAALDEGDSNADDMWQMLDTQTDVTFSKRFQKLQFQVKLPVPCYRWRLRISSTKVTGSKLQLSCWSLFRAQLGSGNRCSAYLPEQSPLGKHLPSPAPDLLPLTSYVWRSSHSLQVSPLGSACGAGTDWQHPMAVVPDFPAWIEWRLPETQAPAGIAAYKIRAASSGDRGEDPAWWVLEGIPSSSSAAPFSGPPPTKPNSSPAWVKLHEASNIEFDGPGSARTFQVSLAAPCHRFRIKFINSRQLQRPVKLGGLVAYTKEQDAPPQSVPIQPREIAATPYVLANDSRLHHRSMEKGRLVGGICRASGQHSAVGEVTANVFDGNPKTKWLDPQGASPARAAWVEYSLLPDVTPVRLASYHVTSANDHPERDPVSWTLEGIPHTGLRGDECSQWIALDVQEDVKFTDRFQALKFPVSPRLACTSFRLRITKTAKADCPLIQLACLDLFVEDSVITMQDIFT